MLHFSYNWICIFRRYTMLCFIPFIFSFLMLCFGLFQINSIFLFQVTLSIFVNFCFVLYWFFNEFLIFPDFLEKNSWFFLIFWVKIPDFSWFFEKKSWFFSWFFGKKIPDFPNQDFFRMAGMPNRYLGNYLLESQNIHTCCFFISITYFL